MTVSLDCANAIQTLLAKNVTAALLIITVTVRVRVADPVAVLMHQKEANATIIPANVVAVLEPRVAIASAAHQDSGITGRVVANLATVMKTLPSESVVTQRLANALAYLALLETNAKPVPTAGCWFRARAVSNAIPVRTTCWTRLTN